MSKRGGPRKKSNDFSKTENVASDRGLEGSDAAVLDFLYYDAARVGSFLAQIDAGGHLTSYTEGDSVSKIKKRGHSFKLSGELPIVPGVTADSVEGSLTYELSPGDSASQSGQRTYDPLWTNARTFIDFLRDEAFVESVQTAGMGQFVSHSGNLWLLDMKIVQTLIANPMIQEIVAQLPNVGNTVESQFIFALLPMFELGVQVTIIGQAKTVWATLRPTSLTIPTSDISLMHGTQVAGTWTIIGVLDAKPDKDSVLSPTPFDGLPQMAVSVGEMRPHVGRPANAYGVTPLMIYREVAGVH